MSAWDPNASEPDRHARAIALEPEQLQDYLRALADPSWRVRKAALGRVESFAERTDFVAGLVASLASEDNAGLRNAASEALVRVGAAAIAQLEKALAGTDVDVRKLVVETLGGIGGHAAESALRRALYDVDVNVRTAAAEALGRIGGEAAADELLAALERFEDDPQSAAYFLDAIHLTGVSVPLERLEGYFERPVLHRSLYAVLGRTRDERAIASLLAGTTSTSRGNRAAAVVALAELVQSTGSVALVGNELRASARTRESLLEVLHHDDESVVSAAVNLLGSARLPQLAPAILDACSTRTNIELAMAVVRELGENAVAPLLGEVYRVGIESRVLFLELIEVVGAPAHVDELLDIALHTEARTAEAAVRAVGRIGDPSSVEGLVNLARRSNEPELPGIIAHAIAEIGRRSPERVATRLRALLEAEVEAPWLTALGALGRDDDIEVLRGALSHPRSEVRRAAFDAATIYGERFPEESFVLGLADEVREVRVAAARGLSNYRSQTAVDALLAVARDADAWVAAEATRSLGSVGGPKVLATLKSAVKAHDSVLVLAALSALFRLNPPGLGGLIAPALRHVDPEVVREAVSVSIRLPESEARTLLTGLLDHRFWTVRRASIDAIASRGLRLSDAELSRRLAEEEHPLVLESLARLSGEAPT